MAHARRLRFGIMSPKAATLEAWRDVARKSEDLGYDVLLLPDHLSDQWAPLLALLSAAEATTRLRVGTMVIANDFRHPVLLAKEAATLDLLTGGRFELGLGVGHPPTSPIGVSDYQQLGREMDEPGPRVGRLAESVRLIKTFLEAEGPAAFDGEHYRASNLVSFPKPAQRPRLPIMIAGAGPRMLRLAAREAEIVNIAPRPPTVGPTSRGTVGFGLTIDDEIGILREAAGPRYADLELSVFTDRALVTADRRAEIDRLAADAGISAEAVEAMPHVLVGETGQIAERILEHRERHDISYFIIPGVLIEAFAPVVKQLAGR